MDAKQIRRVERVVRSSPKYAGLFQAVYVGASSPRQCIKVFCLDCMGLQKDEIPLCSATACPLWKLRPYQRKDGR